MAPSAIVRRTDNNAVEHPHSLPLLSLALPWSTFVAFWQLSRIIDPSVGRRCSGGGRRVIVRRFDVWHVDASPLPLSLRVRAGPASVAKQTVAIWRASFDAATASVPSPHPAPPDATTQGTNMQVRASDARNTLAYNCIDRRLFLCCTSRAIRQRGVYNFVKCGCSLQSLHRRLRCRREAIIADHCAHTRM